MLPGSYYVLKLILLFLSTSFVRYAYRLYEDLKELLNNRKRNINTMIIGAGYSGAKIIHEIYRDEKSKYKVCCLIDDDENKIKNYVKNIPIVGNTLTIKQNAEKYNIFYFIRESCHEQNGNTKKSLDLPCYCRCRPDRSPEL